MISVIASAGVLLLSAGLLWHWRRGAPSRALRARTRDKLKRAGVECRCLDTYGPPYRCNICSEELRALVENVDVCSPAGETFRHVRMLERGRLCCLRCGLTYLYGTSDGTVDELLARRAP